MTNLVTQSLCPTKGVYEIPTKTKKMKPCFYTLLVPFFIFLICSCNTPSNPSVNSKINVNENASNPDLILEYKGYIIAQFTHQEYERILKDELPEIVENLTIHPDTLYETHASQTLNFGSEQGHDTFCFIYYNYHKELNRGLEKERNELGTLYQYINQLYLTTFDFTAIPNHFGIRIPAYVEYEISTAHESEMKQPLTEKSFNEIKLCLANVLKEISKEEQKTIAQELRNLCTNEFYAKALIRLLREHFAHF